jgi:hypothetical protein
MEQSMKFEMVESIERNERTFVLTLSNSEYVMTPLTQFDKALVAECDNSDKVSDKLLALETITRCLEAQQKGGK